jgi:hypothetical protein
MIFIFSPLTRPGSCGIKNTTLSMADLSVFKNQDVFKNITYLGTNTDTTKPYPALLEHLSAIPTFDKKKYNF